MVSFKLAISEGKTSYAHTVGDPQSAGFVGKRIGETVGGELLGLTDYTLKITGGSDRSGFPLRSGLPGARQVRLLIGDGFGFSASRHGMHRRKSFRGSTISEETVQINLQVEQKGPQSLAELLAKKA